MKINTYNFSEGEIDTLPKDLINGLIELQPKGRVDKPGWIWFEVCDKYSDVCTKGQIFKLGIKATVSKNEYQDDHHEIGICNVIETEWYGCQELNGFVLNYINAQGNSDKERLNTMVEIMTAQFYILKELYWDMGECNDVTTAFLLAMHKQRQSIMDFISEHNLPIDKKIQDWGGWIFDELMDTDDYWQQFDCDILPYFI